MKEFVVIDDGKETDWIDPIEHPDDVKEFEDHWIVDNGFFKYQVNKYPGRVAVIRNMYEDWK